MARKTNKDHAVPAAPSHLSKRSAALWRAVVPSRAKSAERQALVIVALDALDLADECLARVRAEGMTTTTKSTGAIHVHPLMKVEKEQRSLFARLWGQLNFQWNADIDGRVQERMSSGPGFGPDASWRQRGARDGRRRV